MRTPSPIRDDVKELEEKIEDIEQTFGSIAADPASVVPTALVTYCGDYEFADVDTVWRDAQEARTKKKQMISSIRIVASCCQASF